MNSSTESSYLQSTTEYVNYTTTNSTNSSDKNVKLELVIWCIKATFTVLSILIVLVLYKGISEKRKNKVYDSLNLKHISFGIFHVLLTELPMPTKDGIMDYTTLSTELMCVCEISVPMWTMCVALKMFTDVYLFRGRGDVYSAKDFTVFGFSCIGILHTYELFFAMLADDDPNFMSAIRLTTILLIMSIPITVACIIIKSLCAKSSDFVLTVGLFSLLHLIVFIFCDMCIVWFMIAKTTSNDVTVVDTATTVLQYRLIVEVIWFIGSHYLGKALRIYSEN